MKKIFLTLFLLFILTTLICNAQAHISIINPVGTPTLTGFFENVMSHLLSVIAYVAVLFIVVGGIMYVMSGMGGGNDGLKKAAQNTLTFAIIGLALAVAGPSFLKELKTIVLGSPTAPVPTNLSQAPSLVDIVRRTLSFLLSIVGILAIIGLVLGGIMYIFAAGSVDVAKRATKMIGYSLLGIVVSGTALIVVRKVAELIGN